jgi:hypothetical protein
MFCLVREIVPFHKPADCLVDGSIGTTICLIRTAERDNRPRGMRYRWDHLTISTTRSKPFAPTPKSILRISDHSGQKRLP